jgi:hypothetical protein
MMCIRCENEIDNSEVAIVDQLEGCAPVYICKVCAT